MKSKWIRVMAAVIAVVLAATMLLTLIVPYMAA